MTALVLWIGAAMTAAAGAGARPGGTRRSKPPSTCRRREKAEWVRLLEIARASTAPGWPI